MQHTATHCNTHCITLQHVLHRTTTLCSTVQHSATLCNTLQHSAAHCNSLQHSNVTKRASTLAHPTSRAPNIKSIKGKESEHTNKYTQRQGGKERDTEEQDQSNSSPLCTRWYICIYPSLCLPPWSNSKKEDIYTGVGRKKTPPV